jgi:FtsZ-interacting cell division protein ZipA
MSKYGLWLSRKKKPIFIPDSPKTTTMTTNRQPAAEEENNGNTNNNNDDDEMKLEARSAAFVSNQPSRLSPPPQQQQEQQYQDITPITTYPYSIKIEQDPKGSVKISIHVYSQDLESASDQVVKAFLDTREKFKQKGVKVLEG